MVIKYKATIDHKEIQKWIEKNTGTPKIIDNPISGSDTPTLRIDFPGKKDEIFLSKDNPPHEISWKRFFAVFEERNLALIYEDPPLKYDKSTGLSYRFINRKEVKNELK